MVHMYHGRVNLPPENGLDDEIIQARRNKRDLDWVIRWYRW